MWQLWSWRDVMFTRERQRENHRTFLGRALRLRPGRRLVVLLGAGIALTLLIALEVTFLASRHVPEFYVGVLELDAERASEASQELESRVTMLYSDAARDGDWYAQFTDDQINSWLAVDLVNLYREMLGEAVHDPRVKISPEGVTLAARIDEGVFSVVYWFSIEVYLTQPNQLAFRIRKAHVGKLPLPMERVIEEVSVAARNHQIPLRWTQVEGDPVGIVSITPRQVAGGQELCVEKLELLDGELLLAGVTLRHSEHLKKDSESRSADAGSPTAALYLDDHVKLQR